MRAYARTVGAIAMPRQIARKFRTLQESLMKLQQARVKLISEFLSGILVSSCARSLVRRPPQHSRVGHRW